MFTIEDYLNFNQLEDKQKQLEILNNTSLSEACLQQLKIITTPQKLLVLAEPFCPDCLVFVPIIEKMAEVNPNIKLKYLARTNLDNKDLFDSEEQQQIVKTTYNIPSLFKVLPNQTKVIYKEFPETLKQQMDANPEGFAQLKQNYRQGQYQKLIEQQILQSLI